jgi:hypothetical protein
MSLPQRLHRAYRQSRESQHCKALPIGSTFNAPS